MAENNSNGFWKGVAVTLLIVPAVTLGTVVVGGVVAGASAIAGMKKKKDNWDGNGTYNG